MTEEAERLSARLAVLDPAFAGTANPDRVVVEIANDFPDVRGRLLENGAAIGLGHRAVSVNSLLSRRDDPDAPNGADRPGLRPTDAGNPIEFCGETAI